MAICYRFGDNESPHFITFAVINWIDALSRPKYSNATDYCTTMKSRIELELV